MTKFNIIQKFPNHEILYFDVFTNKIFIGSKIEAVKICLLLNNQQKGVFIINEVK